MPLRAKSKTHQPLFSKLKTQKARSLIVVQIDEHRALILEAGESSITISGKELSLMSDERYESNSLGLYELGENPVPCYIMGDLSKPLDDTIYLFPVGSEFSLHFDVSFFAELDLKGKYEIFWSQINARNTIFWIGRCDCTGSWAILEQGEMQKFFFIAFDDLRRDLTTEQRHYHGINIKKVEDFFSELDDLPY